MSYNYITNRDSPNFTRAADSTAVFGMPRVIEGITIHWWGDPNQNPQFDNIVNYLCRPGGNSSAHYVASGTGRKVACIVNPGDVAWHSGAAWGNARTIGIECDPRARDEDYDVVAELVADIRSAYGDVPIYWHSYFSATACPGAYSPERIDKLSYTKFSHTTDWGKGGNKNPAPSPPAKILANADQIRQAYREILEREADSGGLTTYLNANMTIEEVRGALQSSQEYKTLQDMKASEAARVEAAKKLYKLLIDGKQVAAYSTEENAYSGYVSYGRKGAITQNNIDLTKIIVDKYTQPSPTTKDPDGNTLPDTGNPVTEKDDYGNLIKENNNLLKQIIEFLKKIFNIK